MVAHVRQSMPGERWRYLDRFVFEVFVQANGAYAGRVVQDLSQDHSWHLGHVIADPDVYIGFGSCVKLDGQESPTA